MSSRSPNYYTELEWMLAIPHVESFEFIDKLCEEKESIRVISVGGNYSGSVVIDYKKSIGLVQNYLQYFDQKDRYRINSQIKQGIDDFIQYFSKYDSSKIGHIY